MTPSDTQLLPLLRQEYLRACRRSKTKNPSLYLCATKLGLSPSTDKIPGDAERLILRLVSSGAIAYQGDQFMPTFQTSDTPDKPAGKPKVRPSDSAYEIPAVKQGNRDQPGSRAIRGHLRHGQTAPGSVTGEKNSCTAAASLPGSSGSQTGITSHTPSTFAAPTQSCDTADARRPDASPVKHGI